MPHNCKTCARQGQTIEGLFGPTSEDSVGFVVMPRSAETAVTDDEHIERAISVAGQFRSGGGDGATKHDLYLQEAYRK